MLTRSLFRSVVVGVRWKGSYSAEAETHFGFTTVSEEEKRKRVDEVFASVAGKYDLMNDVMSLGVHRLWKDEFVRVLNPKETTRLVDVAGGTGDIALRFLSHNPPHRRSAVVVDVNEEMLKVGQGRAGAEGAEWVLGDAESLPLPDNSFDVYTIAFGIRNCVHIPKFEIRKVAKEAFRVLKPGGRLLCLEFSHVDNPVLKRFYDAYSFGPIPAIGGVVAGDWESYAYLVESIRKFPRPEVLAGMFGSVGFRFLSFRPLSFGVAAIHSAFKP